MLDELSGDDRKYVEQLIEKGVYSSEDDLLHDAIDTLRQKLDNQRKLEKMQALVQEGLDQLERGEGIPYTTDFMDKVYEEAMEDDKQGKPIPDHVKP